MKPGRRPNLLRLLLALAAVALVGVGVAFYLFRTDPGWYRAVAMTDAEQAAGQQRLIDRLARLRNAVGDAHARAATTPSTRPAAFEIEIGEDEVNGVLLRWSQTDPTIAAALAAFQAPQLRFLPGRIEIAGRSPALDSIVSIGIDVAQSDEGPRVTLGRPWAGRLPLSRSLVETPGSDAVAALREGRPTPVPTAVIDAFEKLIAGHAVAPVVPLLSSVQGRGVSAADVEALTIEKGVLRATLRVSDPHESRDRFGS